MDKAILHEIYTCNVPIGMLFVIQNINKPFYEPVDVAYVHTNGIYGTVIVHGPFRGKIRVTSQCIRYKNVAVRDWRRPIPEFIVTNSEEKVIAPFEFMSEVFDLVKTIIAKKDVFERMLLQVAVLNSHKIRSELLVQHLVIHVLFRGQISKFVKCQLQFSVCGSWK